jgi:quinol monooxygenase YgiN
MPIYQTARFQVRPEAVERAVQANHAFVSSILGHEPGTLVYTFHQKQEDPTRFLNFMVFQDEKAREQHRSSEGVRHFTDVLYPELLAPVEFTEYTVVASTGTV